MSLAFRRETGLEFKFNWCQVYMVLKVRMSSETDEFIRE